MAGVEGSMMRCATEEKCVEEKIEEDEADAGLVVQDAAAIADVEDLLKRIDADAAAGLVVQEGEETVADVTVAAAGGDGEDESTEMSWTDFVVANKRLSQEEIDYILSRQLQPFESTYKFQSMITDSSTTKEDLERAAADHQREQDNFSWVQDRVRKEYTEKGFVKVDSDGIARSLEFDAYIKKAWSSMISELDLHDSDFADELEDDDDDDFFANMKDKAAVEVAL